MNLLLTSVGRRSYIVDWFREAIAGNGLVLATNSHPTQAMERADKCAITPLIYDPGYIPFLLRYCRENRVDALLSLFDVDLLVLARHRDAFLEIGTQVILADEWAVEACNDKWQTHALVRRIGLRSPATYATLADAQAALDGGALHFPVILKPRWGMASIGIYVANNHDELRVLYAKSNEDVFAGHLRYESAATRSEAVLVQQFLDGQEHGLDVVNDLDGNLVALFAKRKVVMRAGETDVGLTMNPEPFRKTALAVSRALRHQAVLSIDCFNCADGIYVTEFNCRISGHYPVAHLAGADVPAQIVRWLQGGETDMGLLACATGVTVIKDLVPRLWEAA
jgi:carbamoyl-phosphate synthase large subunit